MKRLLALGTLVFAASVGNVQATTITFDDIGVVPPGPFNTQIFSGVDLTANEFRFAMYDPPGDALSVYQIANNSANITNGSNYLVVEGGVSQTTLSATNGTPFALLSLDYAQWQGAALAAAKITVIGTKVGGGTTGPVVLSPVGDFTSTGTGTDFQTFNSFGSEWGNLQSVVLTGTGATQGSLNYFAIDNISVAATSTAVPEPGTLSLLGLGAVFLAGRRRNRR
jgi:hypothetical protein